MKTTMMLLPFAVVLAGCASDESTAAFDATHTFSVDVPDGAQRVQVWLPMPARNDDAQKVLRWKVEAPVATRVVKDTRGNEFLHLEAASPRAGTLEVRTTFRVERAEVTCPTNPALTRPHHPEELARLSEHLKPSSQSVIDDDVVRMARAAVGDDKNPISASRKLYDAVLDHVEYHVKDPKPDSEKTMKSSGTGSSRYTYEKCTGNCTDFHSLYAALSRASGIPTRAVYGSFFKGPLNGVDRDQSYHCWIEFHAPGVGWIPLDVAVADVFVSSFAANEHSRPRANLTVADGYDGPDAGLVEYYFGNLEPRRVVWHRGRDLVMSDPAQAGPPLPWNATGYGEIDGKPANVSRKLTYREVE